MIRDYKLEDKGKIIEILQAGLTLDMSYINNDFTNKNNKVMVYDEGTIKGFVLLTPRNLTTKFWKTVYGKRVINKRHMLLRKILISMCFLFIGTIM